MLGFWADGVGLSPPQHLGPNMNMPTDDQSYSSRAGNQWISLFNPVELDSQEAESISPSRDAIYKVPGRVWVEIPQCVSNDAVEWISMADLVQLQMAQDINRSNKARKRRNSSEREVIASSSVNLESCTTKNCTFYVGKWFVRSKYEIWDEVFGDDSSS